MKNKKKYTLKRLFIPAGILLLTAAMGLLISWQWGIHTWEEKTETYVDTLHAIMPEPQGAVLEERSDNTMAVL